VEQSKLPVRVHLIVISLALAGSAASVSAQPTTGFEAYYEFLLGRHLESAGKVDEAVAAFERAARLDPASADIPAELSGVYARQGRFEDARQVAERALAIDAGNADAHRVLGSIMAAVADGDLKVPQVTAPQARTRAIEHLEKGRRPAADVDVGVDMTLGRLYLSARRPEEAVKVFKRVVDQQPEVAEASVLLARAESAAGRPERAVEALESAAEDNPRLLNSLAELYERQQRWDEAAAAYARLSAVTPGNVDTRIRWASSLLQTGAPEALTQARDLLQEVVDGGAAEPRAFYLLSGAERRLKNFAAAEAAARRLIAASPDQLNGPLALAQIYEDQRRFAAAADVLRPAVARHADAAEPPRELLTAVAHLGFAELQAGRPDAAIEAFDTAGRVSAGTARFDAAIAQAHLLARRFDRAAEVARAARQRSPDDLRLVQLEARALARGGRSDRAVVVMRDALAAHGDNVQAHLTLAEVLQDAKRTAEADNVLAAAAEKFPSDLTVPFQRGALLEQRRDYAAAEAAFRQVLERDPLHAAALNYLGYMLADRGERLDEAVALVERALAIDPGNGAYLDSLGWAYFRQEKYDKAEPLLRQAAEQSPGNSVIQDHLGDVLWASGKRREAVEAWRRALAGDGESIERPTIEGKIARAR
jgi:tetratricopeptide (TPR) repeat protein